MRAMFPTTPNQTPSGDADYDRLLSLSVKLFNYLSCDHIPDWDYVASLKAQGADIASVWNPTFEMTALHGVVERAGPATIEYVLREGLDANAKTRGGSTALHILAARWQRNEDELQATRHLIAYGAHPAMVREADGKTPLMIVTDASEGAPTPMTYALLDAGAPLDEQSRKKIDDYEEYLELNHFWWERYSEGWKRAELFALVPDVEALTPELVCALSNIGRLGAVMQPQLWAGHEEALRALFPRLLPWLSEEILRQSPSLLAMLEPDIQPQPLVWHCERVGQAAAPASQRA